MALKLKKWKIIQDDIQFTYELRGMYGGWISEYVMLLSEMNSEFIRVKNRIKNNSAYVVSLDCSGVSRIHSELNEKYLPIFLKFMEED